MSFDLKLFGTKLLRYRIQLKLDIQEVSEKTGISKERLGNFERGYSIPTGDEVLIFSDFYMQNYSYFISNHQKNVSEQTEILYRNHGNEFTKEDRWIVQEFLYLCECEQFLFKLLGLEFRNFQFNIQGNFFKAHGEDAAIALRNFLGLRDNTKINNPYYSLRKLGIHIFRRKLVDSNISGLFINHPTAGKCILINYDEDIFRQNFTLAHEVGHAIFDFKEDINVSNSTWSPGDLKEIRANTFASNFLIPASLLKSFKGVDWTESQIVHIAKELQVNIDPLLIALKTNNIINAKQESSFANLRLEAKDKIDPELKDLSEGHLITKKRLLEKGISDFYLKNCFEAYDRDMISIGKLAEMLLCDDREVGKLLKLFNYHLKHE